MSLKQNHVLIVEDEPVIRMTLSGYLQTEGYAVSEAADGNAMRRIMADIPIDLVLLDIRLPGEDGLSLLRELRSTTDIGLVLVTGRTDAVDRIIGLEMGADDYITKPFNPRELLARVKNLLRRTTQASTSLLPHNSRRIGFDGWEFDQGRRRLKSPAGDNIALTRGEFDLLAALVQKAGTVLSRDVLLNHISHREWAPSDRTVDVLVRRLRHKLEDVSHRNEFITTEHGVGYVFIEPVYRLD